MNHHRFFEKVYETCSLDKTQKVKVFKYEIITFGIEILCGSIEDGSQIALLDKFLSTITCTFYWNSNE